MTTRFRFRSGLALLLVFAAALNAQAPASRLVHDTVHSVGARGQQVRRLAESVAARLSAAELRVQPDQAIPRRLSAARLHRERSFLGARLRRIRHRPIDRLARGRRCRARNDHRHAERTQPIARHLLHELVVRGRLGRLHLSRARVVHRREVPHARRAAESRDRRTFDGRVRHVLPRDAARRRRLRLGVRAQRVLHALSHVHRSRRGRGLGARSKI